MGTADVSIVIPVYNTEKYLPLCIESILNQTYRNYELVFVDDGSTDDSAAVIERYALLDNRIHLIRQQNSHAGIARNRGMDASVGEYVLFLDSDDYFDNRMLEMSVKRAEETSADIVVFGGYTVSPSGEVEQNDSFLYIDSVRSYDTFSREDIPDDILTFSNPAVWNKLYRRSFLTKNALRFLPIRQAEDVPFTKMAFVLADCISYVNEPFVYYRTQREGSNENVKCRVQPVFLSAIEYLYHDLQAHGLFHEVEKSFCNLVISILDYELKPYEDHSDKMAVYQSVFGNETLIQSGVFDHDFDYYTHLDMYGYLKGLQYTFSLNSIREGKNFTGNGETVGLKSMYSEPVTGQNNEEEAILQRINTEMITPKISVIIPVYNQEPYVRMCLDSLLSQTLTEWEAICIDDGSTDDSLRVLFEYAAKDNRFHILHHKNHGVAFTRNLGISLALGQFLFFLDPDDWIHDKDVFLDLYTAAVENDVKVCGGTFQGVYPDKTIDVWEGTASPYTFRDDRLMSYSELQFDYGWVRFIYERKMIVDNGLLIPDRVFYEDPVFFVHVMDVAKTFYALKRVVYCYRTGYKPPVFSYRQIIDLVRGITEIIVLAKERGYSILEELELIRLKTDYAVPIIDYLRLPDSTDLHKLMNELNAVVYPENENRLENDMYGFYIDREKEKTKRETVAEWKAHEEKTVQELKSSFTWKAGRLLLLIPRTIKKVIMKLTRR